MCRKIICAFFVGLGMLCVSQAFAATDAEGFDISEQQVEDTGIWRWGTVGVLINQRRWEAVALRPKLILTPIPARRAYSPPKPKPAEQPVAVVQAPAGQVQAQSAPDKTGTDAQGGGDKIISPPDSQEKH